MDKAIRAKWLEALRSGKYEQGRNSLRQTDSFLGKDLYCCLGVLCDIVRPQGWTREDRGEIFWLCDAAEVFPPFSVLKASQLPLEMSDTLAEMNDQGRTFEQIAQTIEEEL